MPGTCAHVVTATVTPGRKTPSEEQHVCPPIHVRKHKHVLMCKTDSGLLTEVVFLEAHYNFFFYFFILKLREKLQKQYK